MTSSEVLSGRQFLRHKSITASRPKEPHCSRLQRCRQVLDIVSNWFDVNKHSLTQLLHEMDHSCHGGLCWVLESLNVFGSSLVGRNGKAYLWQLYQVLRRSILHIPSMSICLEHIRRLHLGSSVSKLLTKASYNTYQRLHMCK